ncbi:hypothetical protein Tco_0011198 [Tanacetum coccineum]
MLALFNTRYGHSRDTRRLSFCPHPPSHAIHILDANLLPDSRNESISSLGFYGPERFDSQLGDGNKEENYELDNNEEMMTGNSWLLSRKAYSKWEGSSLSFGVVFSTSIEFAMKRARSIMSAAWQVSSLDGGNLIDFSKSKGFYKGDVDVNLLEVP